MDNSQEVLTYPSDALSRRVRSDVDEVRIHRSNDGEQEVVGAFYETVIVRFAAEVEVMHAVVPEQTVEGSRTADVPGEKSIDIVTVGEELAQPENRSPSIPGGSVVLYSPARVRPTRAGSRPRSEPGEDPAGSRRMLISK